jgi:DtxR family Mn-dependent transcriptional regulator
MTSKTGLSESMENYLEVILELEQANKVARAKDIGDKLGVQRGSVTGALKNLEEKGFINYAPYSFITLTKKGNKIAKNIAYRHAVLKDFLLNILQIDPETAENTACSMEHAIDVQTLERLVRFIDYIHKCPRTGEDWIKAFVDYCTSDDRDQEKCDQCIDTCITLYKRDKS